MLGESIEVSRDGAKIVVTSKIPFSKRYLKYLAKKYLKKQAIRDFCRVVADGKMTYKVKYLHLGEDEEEDMDEEDVE